MLSACSRHAFYQFSTMILVLHAVPHTKPTCLNYSPQISKIYDCQAVSMPLLSTPPCAHSQCPIWVSSLQEHIWKVDRDELWRAQEPPSTIPCIALTPFFPLHPIAHCSDSPFLPQKQPQHKGKEDPQLLQEDAWRVLDTFLQYGMSEDSGRPGVASLGLMKQS